ncbi:hypothetical protein AOT93_24975 [Mycobacteroides sp. H110]|nr:hypothetical protein AOT87_07085 [Mycobacteroides sp. H003]KRQ35046.1 hypothetical protein AOT91_05500 [Mycobacteroides sp. H092]KRQ39250.1 hypothetical protein AOT92_18275 [Mycobacteroides sp. H101]KRQ48626.1 hypothetical protein AOT88_13085 [Mycobacteroides sp. H063]KRQ60623.1 hypothetical protein AOT90_20655 [Mycobacteroides sp. H079]KRQ75165.1 hypothetical protein AOT93_24975 [Mycobacteroides sp. H110]KRQ77950.1 hypothetical protein AOT95_20570 [Mycobacteroides sp. HXXIII]
MHDLLIDRNDMYIPCRPEVRQFLRIDSHDTDGQRKKCLVWLKFRRKFSMRGILPKRVPP